jgi:hypothetical protein
VDVASALTTIKRQFGDEYDVIITDIDIYAWIHDAELDIIRNTSANNFTINVATSAFPTSVPDSVNIRRLSVNGKALQFISKEELDLLHLADTQTGTPSYWYKSNKQVFVYPADTASTQQIQVTYNKVPSTMTGLPTANSFTVPEVYHEDVIKYCLARAHNKNHDAAAEKQQMDLYDRGIGTRRDESHSPDAPVYKIQDPWDYE